MLRPPANRVVGALGHVPPLPAWPDCRVAGAVAWRTQGLAGKTPESSRRPPGPGEGAARSGRRFRRQGLDHQQVAILAAGELAGDVQAETDRRRPAGSAPQLGEPVEDALALGLGDAGAGVLDGPGHGLGALPVSRQPHRLAVGRVLAGVVEQVAEDLDDRVLGDPDGQGPVGLDRDAPVVVAGGLGPAWRTRSVASSSTGPPRARRPRRPARSGPPAAAARSCGGAARSAGCPWRRAVSLLGADRSRRTRRIPKTPTIVVSGLRSSWETVAIRSAFIRSVSWRRRTTSCSWMVRRRWRSAASSASAWSCLACISALEAR